VREHDDGLPHVVEQLFYCTASLAELRLAVANGRGHDSGES